MKREHHSPLGYYTIGIAGLFLAGFFLLVVFGAQSYRNTVGGQNRNMHSRALLSYLATTVKAADTRDGIRVLEDPEVGPVLVLEDGNSGYAQRIYRFGCLLLEDYAGTDAPLRPEEAEQIGTAERFLPVLDANVVLKIETDAGKVLVHLRSGGGSP